MNRNRLITVLLLVVLTWILFPTRFYADQNQPSAASEEKYSSEFGRRYAEVLKEIEESNLPQELKDRMIQHNKYLYDLSFKVLSLDPKLLVAPENANKKPINVEMSFKYNTFVYGEPSGPHPSMIGKTNEPWLLALTYIGANFNFGKSVQHE